MNNMVEIERKEWVVGKEGRKVYVAFFVERKSGGVRQSCRLVISIPS